MFSIVSQIAAILICGGTLRINSITVNAKMMIDWNHKWGEIVLENEDAYEMSIQFFYSVGPNAAQKAVDQFHEIVDSQ